MKQPPTVCQGQPHSKRFHHLSHAAYLPISIHNILEVSRTSYKTIQMNLKHSPSSIKASKSFSIHKVCFHNQGLGIFFFFYLCKWIVQFTSTQCEWLCVPLFLGSAGAGLTSGPTRSVPDIAAPLLSSFPPLHLSATALLICGKKWNFYIGQSTFWIFLKLTQGSGRAFRTAFSRCDQMP